MYYCVYILGLCKMCCNFLCADGNNVIEDSQGTNPKHIAIYKVNIHWTVNLTLQWSPLNWSQNTGVRKPVRTADPCELLKLHYGRHWTSLQDFYY